MITPRQCKAARALLGWNQHGLAKGAGISTPTVGDFERGARSPIHGTMEKIELALKTAGIRFIGQTGVDLK